MATNTLLDFAKAQIVALTNAKKDVAKTFADAQADLAEARTAQGEVTKDLAELDAKAAFIRKQLAVVTTPADAEPLLASLEKVIVQQHGKQADSLTLDTAVKLAQADSDRASAQLSAVTAALKSAEDALKEVQARDDRRKGWKDKLNEEPLKSIPTAAGTALANPPFTDAKARVETDLPVVLLTRARERRDSVDALIKLRQQAVTDAQALVNDAIDKTLGPDDKIEKLKQDFESAEQAFRVYVTGARDRFDFAVAGLPAIADKTRDPLTKAESDNIKNSDPNVEGLRETAAQKEQDRDQALMDYETARADLDTAILKARAADVDDPDIPGKVLAEQTDFDNAKTAFEAAESAYTAIRKDLDEWEAGVPDSAWRRLADFLDSKSILNELLGAKPADLITAMDDAEKALVTALLAADKNSRTLALLKVETDKRATQLDCDTSAAGNEKFSALRGDN